MKYASHRRSMLSQVPRLPTVLSPRMLPLFGLIAVRDLSRRETALLPRCDPLTAQTEEHSEAGGGFEIEISEIVCTHEVHEPVMELTRVLVRKPVRPLHIHLLDGIHDVIVLWG